MEAYFIGAVAIVLAALLTRTSWERDEATREARRLRYIVSGLEAEKEAPSYWAKERDEVFAQTDKALGESEAARGQLSRLRRAQPDPTKLELLAAWLDARFPNDDCPDVQNDLRTWAREINAQLCPANRVNLDK